MPKKKLVSVFPYNGSQYLRNIAFDSQKNHGIERTIFLKLKKYLNEKDIDIQTVDLPTEKEPFRYVYFDMPYPWNIRSWRRILQNRNKNVLICNESALIIPFNYWKI